MKHVINTSNVAAGVLNHMNGQSALAFMNMMLQEAEKNDVKIEENVVNQLTTFQKNITQRLNETDQNIARAESLARLLEGSELTQIEEILRNLVDSDKMQALFESMCVNVGGGSYKATSVIEALATAPQEVSGEHVYSPDGSSVTGYKMQLDSGLIVSFDAEVTEDKENSITSVQFTATDFNGVPAKFGQTMIRVATPIQVFGKAKEFVQHNLKTTTHVVIDLAAEGCANHADPVPDVDGDGDNDGIINTPAADANPVADNDPN